MKCQVYYTNFDYYAAPVFNSIQEAKQYGISKGFEFQIHDYFDSQMPRRYALIGWWNQFSGWHSALAG